LSARNDKFEPGTVFLRSHTREKGIAGDPIGTTDEDRGVVEGEVEGCAGLIEEGELN